MSLAEAEVFDRAALLIEHNGWWDGETAQSDIERPRRAQCIWSAVQMAAEEIEKKGLVDRPIGQKNAADLLLNHLQVGTYEEIWALNDQYRDDPEAGKTWAIETLLAIADSRL